MADLRCRVRDCQKRVKSKELCTGHYERQRRGEEINLPLLRHRKPMEILYRDAQGRKHCISCNEWLPESSFSVQPKRADGLYPRCKSCVSLDLRGALYGVGADGLRDLFDQQGGKCGACGIPLEESYNGWHVDHDHKCCPENKKSCGRCVRGLLCSLCNIILGISEDSVDRLRGAADYLEGWHAANSHA